MSAPNKHGMMQQVTQSARHAFAITPDDSNDLSAETRTLYVGGTGDLAVVHADDPDGTVVVYKAIAAGVYQGMAVKRVMSTGTTATNLVGGW